MRIGTRNRLLTNKISVTLFTRTVLIRPQQYRSNYGDKPYCNKQMICRTYFHEYP